MAFEYITKWITPPEAYQIAASLEKKAAEVLELAAHLDRIKSHLQSTWEGNSKNRFIARFENLPGQLRSYADELLTCAKRIRSIKVAIKERVWVPDPKPTIE